MKFLSKVSTFCVLTVQMVSFGVVSFGPVLSALMGILVWGMFFSSLGMLGACVFIFGLIGAFMNGYTGNFPDGMPRRQIYNLIKELHK